MSQSTRVLPCLALALVLCVTGCRSQSSAPAPGKVAAIDSFLKLAKAVDGGLSDGDAVIRDAKAIIDDKQFPAQFTDLSAMQGNSSGAAEELVRAIGRSVKRMVGSGKVSEARKLSLAGVEFTKAVAAKGPEILAAKAPSEPTEEAKALRVANLHAFKIWCMTSILDQLHDLKATDASRYADDALKVEKARSVQLETLVSARDNKRILAEFSAPTRIDAALDTIEQALH